MSDTPLRNSGMLPGHVCNWPVGPDSELAQQVAKDPYNFEFLGLSGEVAERDLEQALMDRITEKLRAKTGSNCRAPDRCCRSPRQGNTWVMV